MKCNCVEKSADLSTREFITSQPIMNIQGRSYKSIFKVNATGFRNVISAEYCFTKGDDNLYNVCKEAITDFDDDFVGQLTAFGPFAIQYANSREETLQNSLVFIQSFVKGRKEPETLQSFAQISVVRRICSSWAPFSAVSPQSPAWLQFQRVLLLPQSDSFSIRLCRRLPVCCIRIVSFEMCSCIVSMQWQGMKEIWHWKMSVASASDHWLDSCSAILETGWGYLTDLTGMKWCNVEREGKGESAWGEENGKS